MLILLGWFEGYKPLNKLLSCFCKALFTNLHVLTHRENDNI